MVATPSLSVSLQFTVLRCSLGWLACARSIRGVRALVLGDEDRAARAALRATVGADCLLTPAATAETWVEAVRRAADAEAASEVPLDLQGTSFQRSVWATLQEIPAGETVSYQELARRTGVPRAVRAVASACAANAIAVLVPCHRVIRTDGGLGGYRWGVARKQALLAREGARLARDRAAVASTQGPVQDKSRLAGVARPAQRHGA